DENEVDVIAEQVDHRASLSKTRECSAPRTCCDWLGCEPVSLLSSLPRRTVAIWRCKNPTELALIMSTRYATKSPTPMVNKMRLESRRTVTVGVTVIAISVSIMLHHLVHTVRQIRDS